MKEFNNHPKVFISYSWDNEDRNEEHKEWVKKLAIDLSEHGVEVVFDQFNLRLGDDLMRFMENGLSTSHLVICVCSENYVTKANSRKGGVGYENRIISSELFTDSNKKFIIPIDIIAI